MKTYLVYGFFLEDIFSLRKFFEDIFSLRIFFEDIFSLRIFFEYIFSLRDLFEDIFSLRETVLELQKAQGPDLAPNPVKQAFFKRKKSIFGGL